MKYAMQQTTKTIVFTSCVLMLRSIGIANRVHRIITMQVERVPDLS